MKIEIDSDMLRNFVFFYKLTKDGNLFKYKNPTNIDNEHVRYHYDEYVYLFDCIKSGLLELYVSKYVYMEVEHDENVVEFVKKYCHRQFDANEEKIEKLAYAYCEYYTYKGEKLLPPMKRHYVAAINKRVPTNDCYIMAHATINMRSLLTNNVHDFVFDKNSADIQNHRRSDGIKYINSQLGYKKKGHNDDFIPAPIVIKKLVKYLSNLRERDLECPKLVVKKFKQNKSNSVQQTKPNDVYFKNNKTSQTQQESKTCNTDDNT